MDIWLMLTACLVNFGSASVQPHHQIRAEIFTGTTNNEKKIQGNFRNLFDSIAKSDKKNCNIYREILQHEVTKEQQAFDAMKEKIQNTRNRNSDKRKNFYEKYNIYERQNRVAIKRKTKDYDYDDYDDTGTTEKPVINVTDEQFQQYKDACNKTLGLYLRQKEHVDSVKLKYFEQLKNASGIEIKKFYDLMFRHDNVIYQETKFLTDRINLVKSNFTEWLPPIESMEIVKLLHNWKELMLCIDEHKGENPPDLIISIREEAMEAFDEIAPWCEDVAKLMQGLPKQTPQNEKDKKDKENHQKDDEDKLTIVTMTPA